MAFLAYYTEENRRHADAYRLKVDFATAVKMTERLCEHFGVKTLPAKLFTKGAPEFKRLRATRSWYNTSGRFIVYHPAMLSPLTVAHEVAHYVDHMQCLAKRKARKSYHNATHASLTDQAVAVLKDTFKALFTNPKTQDAVALKALVTHGVDIAQTADQMIADFYAKLPEKLTCPCCHAYIPKMNFGVRVMKRDALGAPVVIRRQSYCKACR